MSAQVAKEYSDQLGTDQCMKLFEQFKSYEGLYFFLGSFLSSRYFAVEYRLLVYLSLPFSGGHPVFLDYDIPLNGWTVRILKSTSSTLRLRPKLDKLKRSRESPENQISTMQRKQRTF